VTPGILTPTLLPRPLLPVCGKQWLIFPRLSSVLFVLVGLMALLSKTLRLRLVSLSRTSLRLSLKLALVFRLILVFFPL